MKRTIFAVAFLLFAAPLFGQTGTATISFTASVTQPASNIGYNIYRGTTSNGEVIVSPLVSPNGVTCVGTACTYTDKGPFTPGVKYYWYVKAITLDTHVLSSASNEYSLVYPVTPVPPAAPAAPAIVSVTVTVTATSTPAAAAKRKIK